VQDKSEPFCQNLFKKNYQKKDPLKKVRNKSKNGKDLQTCDDSTIN